MQVGINQNIKRFKYNKAQETEIKKIRTILYTHIQTKNRRLEYDID